MAVIQIDLCARVVSEKTRVWRLFPGKNYAFLGAFRRQQAAFLDFPGLIIPDGKFDPTGQLTIERIVVSTKLKSWFKRRNRSPDDRPSNDPHTYAPAVRTASRSGFIGNLNSFFNEANEYDLIVVPSSYVDRKLLLGELIEPPTKRSIALFEPAYGKEPIPARNVKWLTEANELRFSRGLVASLRTPNPFTLLQRSFYNEIFEAAYGSFSTKEIFAAQIRSSTQDFTDRDNFDFSALMLTFAAAYQLSVTGDHSGKLPDLEQLSALVTSEYASSLSINVNSPGVFQSIAGTMAPLAISAFIAFAMDDNAYAAINSNQHLEIKVVNSEAPFDDKCTANIDAAAQNMLQIMGFDRLKTACTLARKLSGSIGLDTDSKVIESK